MSETPCQPSQQENGHIVTDPADIATETATSNPEQDTTASKREEVSQFSPHARSAEGPGAMNSTETVPDATQSEDSSPPAVVTLPDPIPSEKAVSGANLDDADEMPVTMSQIGLPKHLPTATDALNQFAESWGPAIDKLDAKIDAEGPWGPFANEETRRKLEANGKKLAEKLLCDAPATGTEAQVCADIAKRQRRGLAKYGKTVIGNPLSFAQWLQHFYEELLDGAIYAKRILTMNHDNQNENPSDGVPAGVLPDNANPPNRHRKPGAGRKAKPCPGCGAVKSIGSTVKNGIPTRRCKNCGHVVQTYPHLANVKAAE